MLQVYRRMVSWPLRRSAASSGAVRAVSVLIGGTAFAQVIPIALTPLLSRLFSPSDMGIQGLYTSFISFASASMTLGYSQAIVSGVDEEEGALLSILSALLVVPMAMVGSFTLLVLIANDWLGFGELSLWVVIPMAASLILSGIFYTLRYWMIRTGAYRTISGATIAQSVSKVVTQTLAGLLGLGWTGLIAGEVIGRAGGLNAMWRSSKRALLGLGRGINVARLANVASRYKKFPLFTTPSSLLNNLALVLPVPLITMSFGIFAAGQYAIATRIMFLPLSLIGTSIGDVFHNKVAVMSREAPEKARSLFWKTVVLLVLIGFLPTAVVALWGPKLFPLVLGSNWDTAGSIAAAVTPWILVRFAVNPVSRVVQVYQGQEFKLVFDVLGLVSVIGVFLFATHYEWTLIRACLALGWSQAAAYGVYLLLLDQVVVRGAKH